MHTVPHFHCICVVQECEDLKKENKYLSNEIHMERIMMRTESELTMRNMRNLNQELQAHVKEVCTLHIWNHSQCRRAELLLYSTLKY